ncbi:cell division control protein 14, SIN component-domain-containing protein, partial [Lentinula raphanica]
QTTSPRTTGTVRTAILKRLEVLVGSACLKSSGSQVELDELMQLQDSFECNIPSKLLPWIFSSSLRLETLATSCKNPGGESESSKNDQLTELTTQLILALSIIQGVALNHQRSKRWLGKTKSLEILVDLLLASRHVPSSIFDTAASTSSPKKNALPPSLTSTILDTMLCILVDSTLALRSFEQCNGVQAIVKILKRAGSPREVRMKCLEFLYFYLLDETKPSVSAASSSLSTLVNPQTPIQPRTATTSSQSSIFPPTVPNTPATPPNRPSPKPRSEYGSSTFSFPHSSYSAKSFTSTSSTTSANSVNSSRSNASSTTTAPGSVECSPKKTSSALPMLPTIPSGMVFRTPPGSPEIEFAAPPGLISRSGREPPMTPAPRTSYMMLQKDVDYVPQSPQKAHGVLSRGSSRERGHSRARSVGRSESEPGPQESRQLSSMEGRNTDAAVGMEQPPYRKTMEPSRGAVRMEVRARTTEEKKELLGTMLGNVDALVEGVRKAGIWGLG